MATNPDFIAALFAAYPPVECVVAPDGEVTPVEPLASTSLPPKPQDAAMDARSAQPSQALPSATGNGEELPDFNPVPLLRTRSRGWTALRQQHFIAALRATGSVGMAARAVGMGRQSAYRLRERDGADSFAAAWDQAIRAGQLHQYAIALERAIEGVTTIRISRGGSIDIGAGPDMQIVNAALRERPKWAR